MKSLPQVHKYLRIHSVGKQNIRYWSVSFRFFGWKNRIRCQKMLFDLSLVWRRKKVKLKISLKVVFFSFGSLPRGMKFNVNNTLQRLDLFIQQFAHQWREEEKKTNKAICQKTKNVCYRINKSNSHKKWIMEIPWQNCFIFFSCVLSEKTNKVTLFLFK